MRKWEKCIDIYFSNEEHWFEIIGWFRFGINFSQQGIVVFILLTCIGAFCQQLSLDKVITRDTHQSIRARSRKANSPSGRYAEPRQNYREDDCCVRKKIVQNGKIKTQCRSEHPDCFSKSDPRSPYFRMCETMRNSQNDVVACRCAAQKMRQ